MNLVHNIAVENMAKNRDISTKTYNLKAKYRELNVGNQVLYRTHFLSKKLEGFTAKLAPKWEGPYEVTSIVSSSAYDVKHTESGQLVNKVHINDLINFKQ